ncbi:hypothetical protein [Rubritalea tangerina]|uniref:hypothetical protein n=1 Tax=Rubritalea tangerina TaxID=430798 RepID=UPI0036241440
MDIPLQCDTSVTLTHPIPTTYLTSAEKCSKSYQSLVAQILYLVHATSSTFTKVPSSTVEARSRFLRPMSYHLREVCRGLSLDYFRSHGAAP